MNYSVHQALPRPEHIAAGCYSFAVVRVADNFVVDNLVVQVVDNSAADNLTEGGRIDYQACLHRCCAGQYSDSTGVSW